MKIEISKQIELKAKSIIAKEVIQKQKEQKIEDYKLLCLKAKICPNCGKKIKVESKYSCNRYCDCGWEE